MKEVGPDSRFKMSDINIKELIQYLFNFLKNPIQEICLLPNWNWKTLFLVQVVISIISGALAGLIKLNFYRLAYGIFLMPIVSTVSALILTTFFYYYIQFFENRTESFRKLFIFVILTSIPFYLFQILAEIASFVVLVGFAFSAVLMAVGLVENFQIAKRRAYEIVLLLYGMVFLTWILNKFTVFL